MFPDVLTVRVNEPARGKVFTARLGSLGIGVQSRTLDVDEQEWEVCQRCPHFRSCYDLGMAKLALENALR